MIKWLGAAAGPELAIIGALGAVLVFGAGVYKGGEWERNEQAAEQLEQSQKLDDKSAKVSLDVDEIAEDLSTKIGTRMAGRELANAEAIEKSAKAVGRLEGEADGYLRGFKDAETKLKDTCYTDPAFLSDGMRRDAQARYEAIFGSQGASQQGAKAGSLQRHPKHDAPSGPAN